MHSGHEAQTGTSRADRLRVLHQIHLDALFAGRDLRYVRPVSVPSGSFFLTALGQRARRGHILRDTDTGERFAVGDLLLHEIVRRYQVLNLPDRLPYLAQARAGRPPT